MLVQVGHVVELDNLVLVEEKRGGEKHERVGAPPVREDPAGLVDVFKQLPVTLRPAKVEPGHLEVCIKLGSIPLVRPAEAIQEGGALRVLAHKGLDALGETVGHLGRLDVDVNVAVARVAGGHQGEGVVTQRPEQESVRVEGPDVIELIELRHAPHESRLPSDHQTVLHREAEHTVGHCRGRQVCGHLVLEQDQVEAPRG
mmetsp:Transcript_5956/g.19687  ORF Transcript_5956/g.19687 Transcript_5956/m.19687 type:complete len:200 (-) Transcript_5956:464-1063(-)